MDKLTKIARIQIVPCYRFWNSLTGQCKEGALCERCEVIQAAFDVVDESANLILWVDGVVKSGGETVDGNLRKSLDRFNAAQENIYE
jgi:hypothetical protein